MHMYKIMSRNIFCGAAGCGKDDDDIAWVLVTGQRYYGEVFFPDNAAGADLPPVFFAAGVLVGAAAGCDTAGSCCGVAAAGFVDSGAWPDAPGAEATGALAGTQAGAYAGGVGRAGTARPRARAYSSAWFMKRCGASGSTPSSGCVPPRQ